MKQDFGSFNADEVHKYEKEYFDYQQSRMDLTFYGNWQKDFGKLIIELTDLKSDPGKEWVTVLDVGCAVGLNLRAIDELGIFSRLIGTDISNYLIKVCILLIKVYILAPQPWRDYGAVAGKRGLKASG